MGSNTAELEALLVGPYLWSGERCCNFVHDACIIMKTNPQFNPVLNDGNDEVFGTRNCVETIGKAYWDILKCDEKGNDLYTYLWNTEEKKKSLVSLLKLIRNEIEHIQQYSNKQKKKLNSINTNGRHFQFFYKDNDKALMLNRNQFMAFWIFKFPKLMPYLWLKFYKFKNELTNYYPDNEINMEHFEETYLVLDEYVKNLKSALQSSMENGNVVKRFVGRNFIENGNVSKRFKRPDCSLEFRGFHKIAKILHLGDYIRVSISSRENILLSVSHSCKNEEKLEYVGTAPGTEELILIFATDIEDANLWKHCKNGDCRVIVFCNQDQFKKVNVAVGKFEIENNLINSLIEFPIRGIELSREKQVWVFEQGQVCIQGRDMKIKHILPDGNKVVEKLSGDLLNKLLRNEKPELFADYEYPEHKGVYVERRFVNENVVYKYRVGNFTKEVWFSDGWLGELTLIFNNLDHLLQEKNSVTSDCRFILLKDLEQISDDIFEKVEAIFPSRGIKLVMYGDEGILKVCFGRVAFRDLSFMPPQTETEILNKVLYESINNVFFFAESGMGKTKLLWNLKKRLENSLVIFCSFRRFVDILQKEVGTRHCHKFDIKSVIMEILKCKDICEKHILDTWLDQICSLGAKIDLQLDGLDDVPSENLKLALNAMEIIKNDFNVIRLWVTSNKQFPAELKGLRFFKYSIRPFEHCDQVEFLYQSWTKKYPNLDKLSVENFIRKIHQQLWKLQLFFTNYPLICSILADLYGDKVGELHELTISSVEWHESIVKKMFAHMYEKMYDIVDENSDNFKLLRENYLQLHTHLALEYLFPEVANEFTKPLAMKFLKEASYRKMGIIASTGAFEFIDYVSYAYYFVAQYIMTVLETGELDNLCSRNTFNDLLCFGKPDDNCEITVLIWVFVDDYLGKLSNLSSLKWLETQSKEKGNYAKNKDWSTCLTDVFEKGIWNAARFLIKLWANEHDTTVCNEILKLAVISDAPLNWFVKMSEELCFDQCELLKCSVEKGNYEIAKYLITQKCDDDVFDKLAGLRESGGGILHCIVDRITLTNTFIFANSFIENTIKFIRFVHMVNEKEIERRDSCGRSMLLALPVIQKNRQFYISTEHIFSVREFLMNEFRVDFNESSFDGESILSLGSDLVLNYQSGPQDQLTEVFLSCKETFDFRNVDVYHKTLLLVAKNNFAHINLKSRASGLTPLLEAVQLFGPKIIPDTLTLFRNLGANFNEKDKEGNTVLHYCIKNFDDIEFIKLLVKNGCKVDVQGEELLCALCLAEMEGKYEIRNFLYGHLCLKGDKGCGQNCTMNLELLFSC